MDVLTLSAGPVPAPLAPLGAPHVRTDVGAAVPAGRVDVALACSWEATAQLFAVDAARHALWVDHFAHHRMGAWQAERIAAALAYDLPVDVLAGGQWVADVLADLRPEQRVLVVAPAVDHDAPAVAPADGPLRVRVDDAWLAEGKDSPSDVVLARCAEDVVRVEAEADVLLRLDPVDGTLGSPLHAAARGTVPVVVASAGGTAELVEHLASGVVAEPDDLQGTARWLDHLARDRELLATLAAGARARARDFPDAAGAEQRLRAALDELLATPPPDAQAWPVRLMADAMAAVTVHRSEHHVLAAELRRVEGDGAYIAAQKLRARLEASNKLRPLVRAARRLG